MTYQTLEVQLENGKVSPVASEQLPDKARALLTILTESGSPVSDAGDEVSLADLTADLAGIGDSSQTDLSSNKSRLDDLGR